jgi:diguanylate cyclase (GGDEF)-like protein
MYLASAHNFIEHDAPVPPPRDRADAVNDLPPPPTSLHWSTGDRGWWRDRALLPELGLIIGFLGLLWIGIGITIRYEYDHARTAAIQSTDNLARAFEESTRRTIREIDQTLMSLRGAWLTMGEKFDFAEWARTQTKADWQTVQIGLANRDGDIFASTIPIQAGGVNVRDRPHFRVHLDPSHDDLFISDPVIGRVSRRETIQFTRKLVGPDGQFAGMATFSLGCEELSKFYQTLDIGKGFVALLSANGVALAVGPVMPGVIGTNIRDDAIFQQINDARKGVADFGARWDGMERLASFRRMTERPLVVMVGIANDTVFERYRVLRDRFIWTGIATSAVVALIGMFWLQQRRHSVVSRRALTVTLEAISQGIVMIDRKGRVGVINRRAVELLRLPAGAHDEASRRMAGERARQAAEQELSRQIDARTAQHDGEKDAANRFEITRDDGAIIEVIRHFPPAGGVVETYTDVTDQRLAEARTRYAANHDYITGLPNRLKLRECLEEMLPSCSATGQLSAFILIDLDGFKGVNDTLGHDAGDLLLIEIARRLHEMVDDDDIASRIGGDEFVIIKGGLGNEAEAMEFAERVLRRIAEPSDTDGHQIRVGSSIGIAFHPKDGPDSQTLFKHADIALYRAKADGRGMIRRFDEEMTRVLEERRLLESDLRHALEHDDIEVWFQPQFDCDSVRLTGFEALARWKHVTRGYVPPSTFIPVAESCGLINQLGKRVLERACAQAARWPEEVRVAVNLSPVQFNDSGIREDVREILARTGLSPLRLELEVTESLMASNERDVLATLKYFKSLGIQIALDDFGTGYSSLSYLRTFPFDAVKIDRSFVQAQVNDEGVQAITEAILVMSRHLGLRVVAEGVESPRHLALLQQQDCDMVQGYLLGRPMPEADLANFPWTSLPATDAPEGHSATRLETV